MEKGIMEPVVSQVEKEFIDEDIAGLDEVAEGYYVEDGRFIFGLMAGPLQCVTNVLHEMSHLVELEMDRLLKRPEFGWGLIHGKQVQVGGRTYNEMSTDQALMREARVWAYQLSLQRYYGIQTSALDTVSSARYIDTWYVYRNKVTSEEKASGVVHVQRDKIALGHYANMVESMSKSRYTVMRFKKEWKMRMDILVRLRETNDIAIA